MSNPSPAWDRVPVYGWYQRITGDPDPGQIRMSINQRVTRVDGSVIYAGGDAIQGTIGSDAMQDVWARETVRQALRDKAEAEQGEAFDGAAWDAAWSEKLPCGIFLSFPASDDPDIVQTGYQVKVEEKLNSGAGKIYYIEPLLAHLDLEVPGINLGLVDVPPGSPTAPAPIYAKGLPGGVAALDAEGDVLDARGAKIGTSDSAMTAVASDSSSGFSQVLRGEIAVPRRIASPGGGAVCISMDDAFFAMRTVAGMLDARGQRGTFCITPDLMNGAGKIVDADIIAMHAAGHEIAAHSKTHANFLSLTPAEAVVELEYPKAYLENLLGAPVTTWAYPFGSSSSGRDATTDKYVYPLYDRVLDTNSLSHNSLWPRWDEPPALIQRTAWTESNQAQAMEMVKKAAEAPVIASLFFHNLDTAVNPTTEQVIELLDYAQALGVPLITTREAFGSFHYLANPSFEDGLNGWRRFTTGSGTVEVTDADLADGITGSKVLRITAPAGTGGGYASQQVAVQPGRKYRASARGIVRSGTIAQQNDNFIRVRFRKVDGSGISTEVSSAVTSGDWTLLGMDITTPEDCSYIHFELVCADVTTGAVVDFDHAFFGPLHQGDLG